MNYNPVSIITNICNNVLGRIKNKNYRVRDDQKKITCPHPDYPNAFIVLPKEWLGEHAIRKDRASQLAEEYKSTDIINFAVCMSILDDWGNIPGMDSKDLNEWDFRITPMPLIAWVVEEVLTDFSLAYIVPKESSQPYSDLLRETKKDTAGVSEKEK